VSRYGLLIIGTLALIVLGGSGCGYTAGAPFRSGIETVHVEPFGSREFRRNLEDQLTEAVQKQIGRATPYRLAPKSRADTLLTGEVLEVRQAAFAPDPRSRLPREKQMTLAVRVQWKDLRTGKMLLDQPIMLDAADYLPGAGESEKYTQEKVIARLSERIVQAMYDEW